MHFQTGKNRERAKGADACFMVYCSHRKIMLSRPAGKIFGKASIYGTVSVFWQNNEIGKVHLEP